MKQLVFLLIIALSGGCAPMRSTDPYHPVDRERYLISDPFPATASAAFNTISEDTLTLEQAIEIALANNPEVVARRWDAAVAEERHNQTSGARLPRLGIAGTYTHTLDEQRLLSAGRDGEAGLFTRDIITGDLVVSMPVFAGGRLVSQTKAADLLRQASQHRLARSREELVFNVSSIFYANLAQRQVIASLEFSRDTLAEHLKQMDALIAAKKAARVDRMRTDVRLADIEQQLVREKNLHVIQNRVLAGMLGLDSGHGPIRPEGNLEPEEFFMAPGLETSVESARQQRGDFLAAQAALEAQAKGVDAAKAGHWPTVSLQGAYGTRRGVGSTSGRGEDQGDVGRIGLMVDMPLFDGGQTRARVREQLAALAAAQERFRQLELLVQREVETALLNITAAAERVAAIKKSIALARESLDIEQQKYTLGRGSVTDVLDAQDALLTSETNYCRVLAEYHTARAQLKSAMGEE